MIINVILHPASSQSDSTVAPSTIQQATIKWDEREIESLMDKLQKNWSNPLEGGDLISISSGQLAPTDIRNGLLQAHHTGSTAYKSFREERFETQEKTSISH